MQKEIEQKIMVIRNIKSIDLKKKEITFKLKYPLYLMEEQNRAYNLLHKLQDQILGGDIKITGLMLKYFEEE